jgi:BirA family biotin operon repressor/biotin-[acetyl-CoA-carboxylase] ligase
MFTDKQLLDLLEKRGFHSGSDLGRILGVSRVAIQKRVANLRAVGLPVSRIPGRGYSLDSGITLLNKDTILSTIDDNNRSLVSHFELLQSVNSTNEHVSGLEISPGKAAICITESQVSGRGRRGRTWHSSPYRNLLFSISWCFEAWPDAITGLSLAAGIEIVSKLRAIGVSDLMLKWPNDIVSAQGKIGGILIDVRGEANASCRIDIGLGLNIVMAAKDAKNIDQEWSDLESLGYKDIDRNKLAATCINAWIELCKNYAETGFAAYKDLWPDYDAYSDATISVSRDQNEFLGRVTGVNDAGALLVKAENGQMHLLTDAETSIRLHQPGIPVR